MVLPLAVAVVVAAAAEAACWRVLPLGVAAGAAAVVAEMVVEAAEEDLWQRSLRAVGDKISDSVALPIPKIRSSHCADSSAQSAQG